MTFFLLLFFASIAFLRKGRLLGESQTLNSNKTYQQKGETMENRKYKLTVTLDEKDYEKLQKYKQATGLTTQSYFLKLFHNIQPKELPHPDFFEVIRTLHRINSSMRQIALKTNQIGTVDAKHYWENSMRLQRVIGKLLDKVK